MTPNSNYLKCPSTENGQMNCNIFIWRHSTELNETKWNKRIELSNYIMLWLCLWSVRWRGENSHEAECATGLHWESSEQAKTPSWWKKILLWCNSFVSAKRFVVRVIRQPLRLSYRVAGKRSWRVFLVWWKHILCC